MLDAYLARNGTVCNYLKIECPDKLQKQGKLGAVRIWIKSYIIVTGAGECQ